MRAAQPVWLGATALILLLGGNLLLSIGQLSPLTHHMSSHILLMNLIAPLAALALFASGATRAALFGKGWALAGTTAAQLAVLWIAHVPAVLTTATQTLPAHAALQALLFGGALCFWLSVFSQRGAARWCALLALLVTGKLFCLLAALMVFAPRLLYPAIVEGLHASAIGASSLSDQQLAGLLMIAACPLTYVLAAIVIAAKWLKEIDSETPPLGWTS